MDSSNQFAAANRVDQMEDIWLQRQRRLVEANDPSILRNRDFLQAKAEEYKNMIDSLKKMSLTRDEKVALRLMKATYANTQRQRFPWLYRMGIPQTVSIVVKPFQLLGQLVMFIERVMLRNVAGPAQDFSAPSPHVADQNKNPASSTDNNPSQQQQTDTQHKQTAGGDPNQQTVARRTRAHNRTQAPMNGQQQGKKQ